MCCCKYHVELDMLKVGLNFLRDPKKGMHEKLGCHCHYIVSCPIDESQVVIMCSAKSKVYKSITQLWQDSVCRMGELKKWHKCACLLSECQNCRVDELPLCPIEIIGNLDYKV